MFTVCPKCALTLVVTAADLRIAQGYVRCGRCSSVFNALARLSERQSPDTPGAPPEETVAAAVPARETPAANPNPAAAAAPATLTTVSGTGGLIVQSSGNKLGFFATAPIAKPTVSGAKAGNAALASLLTALAAYGLVTDSST